MKLDRLNFSNSTIRTIIYGKKLYMVKISFPTYFKDITEIENSNLDVFVELKDNYTYTLVVPTPKNIESLMEKDKVNYFEPGHPFLIVKKLTKEILTEAIEDLKELDELCLSNSRLLSGFQDSNPNTSIEILDKYSI